jgi:hypothetical protein
LTERRTVELNDVVCATANHMASRLAGELAVLDLDSSVYYGLDPVGARIWELLQVPTALWAVRDAMVAEFEVDPSVASAHLIALVEQLLEQQLVTLRPDHVA